MSHFSKEFFKYSGLVIIIGFAMVFAFIFELPDEKFHINFLDIGQGDGIFIKTPENYQILIDGGPNDKVLEELNKVMPFYDKSIDFIVLTHPHADHINGLLEVIKKYDVESILITGVEYSNRNYQEMMSILREKDMNIYIAEKNQDFSFGSTILDVIYPFKPLISQDFENVNNSSIGIMVGFKDKKILLTGDLEIEGETELLRYKNLKADIFKAGHHGSKTSSTPALLEKVQPEIVVIQSGKGNKFNHPSKETLENFQQLGITKVRRNDLEGRIEFVF
ncbi:MAG: ComEC/Rec2 family competence protein [Patescibacteria group bacterium]|mgnify:CR=1 FL=1